MRTIKEKFADYLTYGMSLPAFMWQFIFLWLPLLIIVSASVYTQKAGFSLEFYRLLISSAHARIILRSLGLALFNASLCLIIAYPVAHFIALHTQKFKNVLVFLLTLPFFVNFVVHVYAWFFILERNGLLNQLLLKCHLIHQPLHIINSIVGISIVMFQVYAPFIILPLYIMFEKFDKKLIEASMDLGATQSETFWRVIFPLTLPGAKLGFFLVLGMSFGEYIIPQLIGGSKSLFVGTLISEYFIVSRAFPLGAAFTCLSAVVLVSIMLLCLIGINRFAKLTQRKGIPR